MTTTVKGVNTVQELSKKIKNVCEIKKIREKQMTLKYNNKNFIVKQSAVENNEFVVNLAIPAGLLILGVVVGVIFSFVTGLTGLIPMFLFITIPLFIISEAYKAANKAELDRFVAFIGGKAANEEKEEPAVEKTGLQDNDITQRVIAVIRKELSLTEGLMPIDENTSLHNLCADLLDFVELEMGMEKEFGIVFPQNADAVAGPATAAIFEINSRLNEVNFAGSDIGTVKLCTDAIKELLNRDTENSNAATDDSIPGFGEWEMVFVKGGVFNATLGDTREDGGEIVIQKKVSIADFYIGRYPVTRAQWSRVMNDEECEKDGNLPVERISWEMAQDFIDRLNKKTGKHFRLPGAAEWEYAATGGQQSKGYKFSGSNDAGEVAWYGENSGNTVHEVGTKKPNELGIYDMSGNVWEWCSDRWGNFQNLSTYNGKEMFNIMFSVLSMTRQPDDPLIKEIKEKQKQPQNIAEGAYRVRRGCFWGNPVPYVHDSIRFTEAPDNRGAGNGFRLAHSARF